jgi:Domain of unknown function (DUF4377)
VAERTSVLLIALCVALLGACEPERGVMPMRVVKLYVSHRTVPCMGVAPMTCMEVRHSVDAEWGVWYDAIDGFVPEVGYAYALEVEVYDLPGPHPADGSSRAYKLRRLIARWQPELANYR